MKAAIVNLLVRNQFIKFFRTNRLTIAAFTFLIAVFIYGRWIEPQWIEVTRHSIKGEFGLKNPLKIVHLTDLHIRSIGAREAKIISLLELEKPDAILVTGDSVAENANYDSVGQFLVQLHAPLGVWLVDGNWEHWRTNHNEKKFYEAAGVHHLTNSANHLEGRIWLIGLDDEYAGAPHIEKALQAVPENAYRIALFHSPAFFDKSSRKIDLALTGHTHGGQIRLPFLPPLWLPEGSGSFVEGWYAKGASKMYVSRGLGNSVLDFRLFCRPELAIIQLDH